MMHPIKHTLLKFRNATPTTPATPTVAKAPLKAFPIHFPELVELILSFLSDYHLRFTAGRVCRQWNAIAMELLEMEVDWTLVRADSKENDGEWTHQPETPNCMRKLARRKTWRVHTQDDEIKSPMEPYQEFRPESWSALAGTLKEIMENQNAQHKRLDLHLACLLDLQRNLLPLLTIVGPSLERLVVDQVLHRPIALESVLALCPRLLHLSLAYPWPYLIMDIDSAPFDSEKPSLSSSSPQGSTTRALRSLVLRGVIVLKKALLRVICSCPDLRKLRLSCFETIPVLPERRAIRPNNPLTFFEAIAESCPHLQSLQFSKAFEMEPRNRRYGIEYHHRIASLFPMAEEWTFEVNDLFKMQPYYSQPFLGPGFANMTTLVIESPLLESEFPAKWLNTFLVSPESSAHKLLHLRVTGLAFSIWWWDLELRQGHTKAIAKKKAIQNEFFCADIWRCRSLKTLHVRLQDKDEMVLQKTSMRIMCGYVSKVFPELEDLVLEKRFVKFDEDSGLCLLTRLSRLKRLAVVGLLFGNIGDAWVDWLAKDWARTSRTKKQIQNEWRLVRSRQAEDTVARVPFRTGEGLKPGESAREYVIDGIDMRYVGQVRDIVEVVKERLADGGMCWPQMEYLRLQSGKGERQRSESLVRVQSTVRELRPEIEFELINLHRW